MLAEDATIGEDGFDCVYNDAGWWEEQISRVVLNLLDGESWRVGERTIAMTPPGFNMVCRSCRNSRVNRSTGSAPPVKTSCKM